MKTDTRNSFNSVFARLQASGVLLESDPSLPSVCSIIAGEPLRGSWWSHPKAQTIFEVNEALDDHDDVLITKLISGKVTFVHRKLWPELFAIGTSRENWQMKGLSKPGKLLLGIVDESGTVRTDKIRWPATSGKVGDAARDLEKRLLVVATQMHTESGAHAKVLQTWADWRKGVALKTPKLTAETAMNTFEKLLRKLNEEFDAKATLPWA